MGARQPALAKQEQVLQDKRSRVWTLNLRLNDGDRGKAEDIIGGLDVRMYIYTSKYVTYPKPMRILDALLSNVEGSNASSDS